MQNDVPGYQPIFNKILNKKYLTMLIIYLIFVVCVIIGFSVALYNMIHGKNHNPFFVFILVVPFAFVTMATPCIIGLYHFTKYDNDNENVVLINN